MLQHIEMGDVMNEITRQTIELINSIQINEECNIEISKDNKFIIRLNKDNKLRYIGSKYSVQKDIDSFYSKIGETDSQTIFVIFGLGAGEHIRSLLLQLSEYNKVLIVEPSISNIKEFIKLPYSDNILNDERVALCCLNQFLKIYMNNFIKDHEIKNIKLVSFSNYDMLFKDEYKCLIEEFNSMKNIKIMGNNTLKEFSQLFFKNLINNITCLNEFYVINSFKNIYKDKPAIIVSAGPSLEKNIDLLKDVQDKFIIICGPRTFGALVKVGIRPDFICAVDPQDYTYDLMEDYLNYDVPLVFMDIANNKLLNNYRGKKILVANQGMEPYIGDIIGVSIDSLLQGGSVAHFCMGLAVYLGCNMVIFIGQDLAYVDDKFQAESTNFDGIDKHKYYLMNDIEQWKKQSIFVKDINGKKIRTSPLLNLYREEFEQLILTMRNIRFINSSYGAHISGTEAMNFRDALALYNNTGECKSNNNFMNYVSTVKTYTILNSIGSIIKYLKLIQEKSCLGIEYSNKLKEFYLGHSNINIKKVLKKLDEIEVVFKDIEKIGLIAYLLGPAIEKILVDSKYNIKGTESEKELGLKIAEKSKVLYEEICRCIEETLNVIYDVVYFVNYFEV